MVATIHRPNSVFDTTLTLNKIKELKLPIFVWTNYCEDDGMYVQVSFHAFKRSITRQAELGMDDPIPLARFGDQRDSIYLN